jgi:hypothetical protein
MEEFAEPAMSHMVDRLSSEDAEKMNALEKIIEERRYKGAK